VALFEEENRELDAEMRDTNDSNRQSSIRDKNNLLTIKGLISDLGISN